MRLPAFTLHRPRELDEVLELLRVHGEDAAIYMGGTELLLLMKLGFAQPGHLVDAKQIAELAHLSVLEDQLLIGASVTHRRLERHRDLGLVLPALVSLERRVANVRVRNVGTLGGNLCFAEPHSDPAVLLTALEAEVELASPSGRRWLPISQFLLGAFSTALGPEEVLVRVRVPLPRPGTVVGYERIAFKERPDAAVAVTRGPLGARVVVGAVGPRPERVPEAEEQLLHGDLDAAAAAVTAQVEATDTAIGADYRAHLAGVLLQRAWAQAAPAEQTDLGATTPTD